MVDSPSPFDFNFPAAPGGLFPAILGDPGDESGPDPTSSSQIGHMCVLQRPTNTLANDTLVLLAHLEISDPDNFFNANVTSSWASLPRGVFVVSVWAEWAASSTGYRRVEVFEELNNIPLFKDSRPGVAVETTRQAFSGVVRVSTLPFQLSLRAIQTSGDSLNLTVNWSITTLTRE